MVAAYRYLNDFSKALASEVRILLAEVGKLRDERRQLQLYVLSLLAFAVFPFTLSLSFCCHRFDSPHIWVHENK